MFWDMKAAGKPGRTVAGQRGREAGCIRTNGNRCSQKYYGQMHYECDEFPFKSVEPVAANPPFNRCVPKEQNRRMYMFLGIPSLALIRESIVQGQWLKKIYYDQVAGLGKKVGWFQIAFENFGGVKYCDRSTGCMNGS